MVQFQQSPYRFTEPIRYFKSNDPVYYEVDNIPLKQLQENNMWLKDQLAKLEYQQIFNTSTFNNTTVNSSRAGFDELRPYTDGSDNKVYVRPGRYTARINDVFNLQPLQVISKLTDSEYIDTYNFKTNRDGQLRSILNTFKTQLQANSLGMNGLMERAFTRASRNLEEVSQFLNVTDPRYLPIPISNTAELPYPSTIGQVYIYNLAVGSVDSAAYGDATTGFLSTVWHESNWMKKWRGVARTSIVDIPSQLDIEIPAFNPDDFYYINESGVRTNLTAATQRIDLLFIYSKPIDASAATIAKFVNGSNVPTKIYTPALGLVKGAGVGLNLDNRTYDIDKPRTAVPLQDENGNQMIVPNISDELGQNLGFSGIKGSFPSPDDLLNLAPTLVESLESDNIALLGQSILPIAYIVVKKNASVNVNGTIVLTPQDVVDIRPFFRTTELAYNERAGIAAAHPQVSIANPVATENYVDLVAKRLSDRINLISPGTTGSPSNSNTPATTSQISPRVVYSGYIKGGMNWGVEKSLFNFIKTVNPNLSDNDAVNRVRQRFGYPVNLPFLLSPDWDISYWARQLLSPNDGPGSQVHDYINFIQGYEPSQPGYNFFPSFLKQAYYTWSTDSFMNRLGNHEFAIVWVTKKFAMNTEQTPWAKDFKLNVNYFNCAPAQSDNGGIFVTKEISNNIVNFSINVAWGIQKQRFINPRYNRTNTLNSINPPDDPRINYSNFIVPPIGIVDGVEGLQNYQGYSQYGIAMYPTISFEVIGIPENFGESQDLSANRYGDTIIITR
jgi:hypothetical protein